MMQGLPPLQALNPERLKRECPPSGEMPPAKRLHQREYEEIIEGVLERIWGRVLACDFSQPAVYTHTFTGRNSHNEWDEAMTFSIEARPTGVNVFDGELLRIKQAEANTPRFAITFLMTDRYGKIGIWPLLEAMDVPTRQFVYCDLEWLSLREKLVSIVYPWLDFAHEYYGAHNLVCG